VDNSPVRREAMHREAMYGGHYIEMAGLPGHNVAILHIEHGRYVVCIWHWALSEESDDQLLTNSPVMPQPTGSPSTHHLRCDCTVALPGDRVAFIFHDLGDLGAETAERADKVTYTIIYNHATQLWSTVENLVGASCNSAKSSARFGISYGHAVEDVVFFAGVQVYSNPLAKKKTTVHVMPIGMRRTPVPESTWCDDPNTCLSILMLCTFQCILMHASTLAGVCRSWTQIGLNGRKRT
jgi:hypothetical protein